MISVICLVDFFDYLLARASARVARGFSKLDICKATHRPEISLRHTGATSRRPYLRFDQTIFQRLAPCETFNITYCPYAHNFKASFRMCCLRSTGGHAVVLIR